MVKTWDEYKAAFAEQYEDEKEEYELVRDQLDELRTLKDKFEEAEF